MEQNESTNLMLDFLVISFLCVCLMDRKNEFIYFLRLVGLRIEFNHAIAAFCVCMCVLVWVCVIVQVKAMFHKNIAYVSGNVPFF